MKKSKTKNTSRETMTAVKNMVEFMKDEVDRAVMTLSSQEKIEKSNAESVSNVIKMSIDSAFVKVSGQIQKASE
jgi:hypothetical protein